jgi:hypothetical protein
MSLAVWVLSLTLAGKSLLPESPSTPPAALFGRIWRVQKGPSHSPAGTIYIFLSNGTLLETSCVETYRIARWTTDKSAPDVLDVIEDGQLAFTGKILSLTAGGFRFRQTLAHGKEIRDISLKAIDSEFVCPDFPK